MLYPVIGKYEDQKDVDVSKVNRMPLISGKKQIVAGEQLVIPCNKNMLIIRLSIRHEISLKSSTYLSLNLKKTL